MSEMSARSGTGTCKLNIQPPSSVEHLSPPAVRYSETTTLFIFGILLLLFFSEFWLNVLIIMSILCDYYLDLYEDNTCFK